MRQMEEIQEEKCEQIWQQKELEGMNTFEGDRLPYIKFEEGKVTELIIDFSKPFDTWTSSQDGSVKKIIPCTYNGVKHNLWLNIRNPLYSQILKESLKGRNIFKIVRIGSAKNTKYSLVS